MLLLNVNTDLYRYWPVVLLTGAMLIVVVLISIFMYIDHKEVAERKAKATITPKTTLAPTQSWWKIFLVWLHIKKREVEDDDVEEYKDRSGKFQLIGLLVILVIIISIVSTFDFDSINLPSWLNSILTSRWFWVGLILLLIAIIFGKSMVTKASLVKWSSWKPALFIIGILIIGSLIWFVLIPLVPNFWNSSTASTTWSSSAPTSTSTVAIDCPVFNLNGTNDMKKGQWFKYEVNWDDPAISFDPKGGDTAVLYFKKHENATRAWTLTIWKNSAGEKKWKFYPRHPLHGALVGTVYVKSARSDAVVMVSQIKE